MKSLFGHLQSRYVRGFFLKWRDHTHYLQTVEDVNLQGPIVEEVLDAQADFLNSQNFMKDQGYTKHEIDQATELSKECATTLLRRSVARMNHYTEREELYLKPKMFDRWCLYIKMKRLVRYLLKNMENKLVPVKSDLGIAFNRWKVKTEESNKILSGVDRSCLAQRCCECDETLRKQD